MKQTVDIRPIIYFWLNKPEAYETGANEMPKAVMSSAAMPHDLDFTWWGWVGRKWGHPFDIVDLWLDVDRAISRLDFVHHVGLYTYLCNCNTDEPYDSWPLPPEPLTEALRVRLYDILNNEEGDPNGNAG